jgi:hypothetical protein
MRVCGGPLEYVRFFSILDPAGALSAEDLWDMTQFICHSFIFFHWVGAFMVSLEEERQIMNVQLTSSKSSVWGSP